MTASFDDFKGYCQRCNCVTTTYERSKFDDACICPACQAIEEKHPLYQKAAEEQLAHIRIHDQEFSGIGLPDDLIFDKNKQ